MSDPVCPICLDDAVPTDFSVGCCTPSMTIHSGCGLVVKAVALSDT